MAENMRDLKRRMKSIESTEHITNAMRLVSSAKYRRAKSMYDKKSEQLQDVSATIEDILRRICNQHCNSLSNSTRTKEIPENSMFSGKFALL